VVQKEKKMKFFGVLFLGLAITAAANAQTNIEKLYPTLPPVTSEIMATKTGTWKLLTVTVLKKDDAGNLTNEPTSAAKIERTISLDPSLLKNVPAVIEPQRTDSTSYVEPLTAETHIITKIIPAAVEQEARTEHLLKFQSYADAHSYEPTYYMESGNLSFSTPVAGYPDTIRNCRFGPTAELLVCIVIEVDTKEFSLTGYSAEVYKRE
jgi:hypothetical protein